MTRIARRRWITVTIIAIAVAGSAMASLSMRARSAGATAPPPATTQQNANRAALTVSLVQPKPMRWPESVTANGGIAAWQEAVVSAEVGGLKLAEVLVDVGDQVEQGQVLARFDAATEHANVSQAQAAVAEARAHLAEADSNAKRAERLRTTGVISEQDLIQATTRAQAAAAQLESAKARLESAQLMLHYTEVTAPDSGVISARNAMLGSVTGAGAELFRLVRQNRLEWRAELTSAQLSRVRQGMKAELSLPDGTKATGAVRQVAPVMNETTRVGIVYVELDRDTSAGARAGMYASGTIEVGESEGLEVPSSAVLQRDGHDYVFIVDQSSSAALVKVVVGRRSGEAVEVTDGVSANDNIVASGGAFLNDGDHVRVAVADRQPSARSAQAE